MTQQRADDPAVLDGVPFFEDFPAEERRRVLGLSSPTEVAAGAVVIDQGDTALDCFLIVEGSASVYLRGEYVATVGAGSMVGEMALIDHRPRSATVVAETPMRLLAFRTKDFRKLLDEMPKASERILAELQARLDRNREQ